MSVLRQNKNMFQSVLLVEGRVNILVVRVSFFLIKEVSMSYMRRWDER